MADLWEKWSQLSEYTLLHDVTMEINQNKKQMKERNRPEELWDKNKWSDVQETRVLGE